MDFYQKYAINDDIEIPVDFFKKWQELLNLVAKIMNIPSSLIMKVHSNEIEVYCMNTNRDDTPYKVGAKEKLNSGLYCEHVMSTEEKLLVPNALKDLNWNKNPDIELGMISYLGYPLLWPTGKVFGTICVLDSKENNYEEKELRDIFKLFHEQVQGDLDRVYKLKEIEDTNENLKSFCSQVAHDIQGPLALIESYASFMFDESEDDQQIKYADKIKLISNNLSDIVESFLKFSTTRSLKKIEKIKISNLVAEIKEVQQYSEIEISTEDIKEIYGDKTLLKQALTNILNNSIKFKHSDRPCKINISTVDNDNKKTIIIKISDNGIGFSKDHSENIFNPFERINNEKVIGHGIGLSIVKKIIELHLGRVWAEGSLNTGANFFIELPVNIERKDN